MYIMNKTTLKKLVNQDVAHSKRQTTLRGIAKLDEDRIAFAVINTPINTVSIIQCAVCHHIEHVGLHFEPEEELRGTTEDCTKCGHCTPHNEHWIKPDQPFKKYLLD